MDLSGAKNSKNFIDRSGENGPGQARMRALRNFLDAFTLNRRSAENPLYYSGYGTLPPDVKYPIRPVETPDGNMIRLLLAGNAIGKSGLTSRPDDPDSPLWQSGIIRQGTPTRKIKKRY